MGVGERSVAHEGRISLNHSHAATIGTVDEVVITGKPEVEFAGALASVPISAVHTVLELLMLKISTSLPSNPGAQP